MGKTYRAQPALFSAIPAEAFARLQAIKREIVAREVARAEVEGRARRARLLRAADARETWEQFQQGCTRLKGR